MKAEGMRAIVKLFFINKSNLRNPTKPQQKTPNNHQENPNQNSPLLLKLDAKAHKWFLSFLVYILQSL